MRIMRSPSQTTGAFASITSGDLRLFTRLHQKNAATVVPNTPQPGAAFASSSSIVSINSIHTAIPIEHAASIQRKISGLIKIVTQEPTASPRPWYRICCAGERTGRWQQSG
jgi:hypothetical protein